MDYKPKHAAEQSEKKKRKGVAFVALAIGSLALTAGGVYAANSITINGDDKIEFGQGVASTNTCDTSMTTNIAQSWSAGSTDFTVDSVTVGWDAEVCVGKTITVTVLNSSGTAICGIDGQTHDVTLTTDTGYTWGATSCSAGDVAKVALTTSTTNP